MNKFLALVFIISSLLFLSSCASDDEIADELIDYYNNEWIPIHTMKERDIGTGKNILRNILTEPEDNYEQEVVNLYETDIIPIADKVINRFESIQLKNKKVKKLNNMQIKAEKHGRELLKAGIEHFNGDLSDSEHRQKENEVKRKYEEVNDYLEELMDTYNLEYDKEKGKVDGYYELKRKET